MTKGLHKNSLRKVDNPHQWMIDDARMELIQQIKAEVLRLKEEHQVPTFRGDMYEEGGVNGYQLALDKLLSRLSDLEKECEKPNSQWSEEDENRLNAVIELLENTSAIHPNYSHRKLIIWLKSFHLKVKSEKPMNPVLQDFPTTEKEMQDFLATPERIPGPERLNSLERILQEQPVCEGLEEEMDRYLGIGRNKKGEAFDLEDGSPCSDWKDDATSECDIRLARHFYELGRQSKQTEGTEKDEKMFRDAWWHISYSVSNGTSTDDDNGITRWLKDIRNRIQQSKPEVNEGLEEEISDYIDKHFHIRNDETLENGNDPIGTYDFYDAARHFAEWGAEHLKK